MTAVRSVLVTLAAAVMLLLPNSAPIQAQNVSLTSAQCVSERSTCQSGCRSKRDKQVGVGLAAIYMNQYADMSFSYEQCLKDCQYDHEDCQAEVEDAKAEQREKAAENARVSRNYNIVNQKTPTFVVACNAPSLSSVEVSVWVADGVCKINGYVTNCTANGPVIQAYSTYTTYTLNRTNGQLTSSYYSNSQNRSVTDVRTCVKGGAENYKF